MLKKEETSANVKSHKNTAILVDGIVFLRDKPGQEGAWEGLTLLSRSRYEQRRVSKTWRLRLNGTD